MESHEKIELIRKLASIKELVQKVDRKARVFIVPNYNQIKDKL